MITASEALAPDEERSVFLVYGQSWFTPLLAALAEVAAARRLTVVAVLPDRARAEEGSVSAAEAASLEAAGVEVVFAPALEQFWPQKAATRIAVEGAFRRHGAAFRPAYYSDRLTATMRLIGLLRARTVVEFGHDYHWVAMWNQVRRDLALPEAHEFLPPPREADGLAVRPENAFLTRSDRDAARAVYETLQAAQELFQQGEVEASRLLGRTSAKLMRIPGYRVQYLSLADPETLEDRDLARKGDVLLVGGFCGSVRLEDYWILR